MKTIMITTYNNKNSYFIVAKQLKAKYDPMKVFHYDL